MIFPPKKLIPFSLLQEQSTQERAPNKASAHDGQRPNGNWHFQTTKEIAPTKESATTGLRPRQSGLKISILQTFSFGVDLLDAVSSTLPVAQWPPLVLTLDRLSISIFICYSCAARWPSKAPAGHCKGCLENVWSHSRTFRNRQAHITHGNQFCQRCSLFLGTWYYYNLPSKFRSQPVTLSNGMMVHHFRICSHHVSIWFFRRGYRIYQNFFGNAKRKLLKLLEAAGAARGLPGDHGFSPQEQYFQYQRYELRPPNTASGHEPRSASGGKYRTHQNLRSESSRNRRILSFQAERRRSRQAYRQWKTAMRGTVNLTLAQYRPPRKGCKLVFNKNSDCLVRETFQPAHPVPSFLKSICCETASPYPQTACAPWLRLGVSSPFTRGT